MARKYRVVTRNFNGSTSVMTDWLWWNQCKRWIVGRWGHWPPWAFISSIDDYDKIDRKYGFEI